jgi:hypothetical protein
MADFGHAGKITIRKDEAGAEVAVDKGEYLRYRIHVEGANPVFGWACKDRERRISRDFPGHPKQVYEWTWCRNNPQERDSNDDVYSVLMRFTAAVKYTLVVEHLDRNDRLIATLIDADYESQDPRDSFTNPLRVFS